MARTSNESAERIESEMKKIIGISSETISQHQEMNEVIEGCATTATSTQIQLRVLKKKASTNVESMQHTLIEIDKQMRDSDSIKMNMPQILQDTKATIEGSGNNIQLSANLISHLS